MTIELQIDSNIQNFNIIGIRETAPEMMEAEKQYLAMGMVKVFPSRCLILSLQTWELR